MEFITQHNLNDFEIVFIDSSPRLSRKCCFDHFLDKAKIIIHDFDYFPLNNIIGTVSSREIKYHNGFYQDKIRCNLDGVVKITDYFILQMGILPVQLDHLH